MKRPLLNKIKCVLTFSGGLTSGYMVYMMKKLFSHLYTFTVIFCNTGKERNETLDFVRECDERLGFGTIWLEGVTNPVHGKGVGYKIVDWYTAARDGQPFEESIAKHGISNIAAPMCTRELKTYTVTAYLRTNGLLKAVRAIGIRLDEMDRAYDKKGKRKPGLFPLLDKELIPATKKTVIDFWAAMPFTLGLEAYQGNCDMCYKKSLAKLIRIAREEPERLEWWELMETKYSGYVPPSRAKQSKKPPIHFFRQNLSAKDIRRLSGLSDEEIKKELKVETLETAYNGCSESCEAF